MTLLIVLIVIGLFCLIAIQTAKSSHADNNQVNPYISAKPLTDTEVLFYRTLLEALPEYIVLAQVQLASFIKVDKRKLDSFKTHRWQNPINQQSVDYLICTKDFSIVTAIELDDKSHLRDDAIRRDAKKNASLAAANVPLIRWNSERMPSVEIIRSTIDGLFSTPNAKLSPAWLADNELPSFMKAKNRKSSSNLLLPIVLVIGLIWFANHSIKDFSKSFASNSPISQSPQHISHSELNLPKPAPAHREINFQKNDYLDILHQQEIQQENQRRKLLAEREDAIKEEIWNRDFKDKVECTNAKSMVACGNDYIHNREKFEKYWEANKSRYISKN